MNNISLRTGFLFSLLLYAYSVLPSAAPLEILSYDARNSGIGEKSVIILGEKQAVLIDAQWKPSDAQQVADMIRESGRELTHILITHGHPDHYWGLGTILEQFPRAKVLARKGTRDEIANQFAAKWIHWQPMMGADIPLEIVQKNNDSFAGWRFTMHDTLCDGDKVTVRWSASGRHVNSFMGEDPTGSEVELSGISIYRVENNRITADWVTPDNLGFLTQIGVLNPVTMTSE